MWVLGIDTATWTASVGLVWEGRIAAELSQPTASSHSETLFTLIEAVLHKAQIRLSEVELLAVSQGPGSFTGLRIGLSAVKGLAYAGGQKVVAVSTLEALARSVEGGEGLLCACLDARKRQVFAALFRKEGSGVQRQTPDLAIKPQALSSLVSERCLFVGDGAKLYWAEISALLGEKALFVDLSHPRGGIVARMGWERFCRGEWEDVGTLAPAYVRLPELRPPRMDL